MKISDGRFSSYVDWYPDGYCLLRCRFESYQKRIESTVCKADALELFLNTIYLGRLEVSVLQVSYGILSFSSKCIQSIL